MIKYKILRIKNGCLYYIGEHELHKHGCKYLPSHENCILIGFYNSDFEALIEAKGKYSSWVIDGCKWCCPVIHKM